MITILGLIFFLVGGVALETTDRVIPLRPLSHHDRVWHLVKHLPDNGAMDSQEASSGRAARVIPEIFLTRLLTTKVR